MRSLSWLQLTSPSVVSSWGRLCVGRKQETRCVSWPYEVLSLHSTTYVEDQQPRTQPGGEKDLITLCLCECGLPRGESFHFPTCCTPLPLSPSLSAVPRVCCWCVFVPRAHSLSASFNSPPTIYHTRTETRTQTPMRMHFFLFHFNFSSRTHRHAVWIFKPRGSTPSHWVSRMMSFLFC